MVRYVRIASASALPWHGPRLLSPHPRPLGAWCEVYARPTPVRACRCEPALDGPGPLSAWTSVGASGALGFVQEGIRLGHREEFMGTDAHGV